MIRTDVRTLHIDAPQAEARVLGEALENLAKHARKKDVSRVEAILHVDPPDGSPAGAQGLRIPLILMDRGKALGLDLPSGRRRYAGTVDGLHRVIADWIREVHGSDAGLLDLFEKLLLVG